MMESDNKSGTGKVVMFFLLGGLVGAAAALLYAPASGRDTRKRIRDFTDDVKNRVSDYSDDVKDKITSGIERGRQNIAGKRNMIKSAIDAGKEAYSREKERVEHGNEEGQNL